MTTGRWRATSLSTGRYGFRMNANPPGSDPVYKRLYAFPEMVADLLRSLFPDDALGADYDSLRRLPTEYVADDYRQRRGDAVWRLNAESAQGGRLHVLVLLEFQSTDDPSMALRVLEYTAMLYRELLREGSFGAGGGLLPPVLPVVLYNGDLPWRSAAQVRDLVARTGAALSPYQPSQRHVVLDERRAAADDPQLRELTRAVLLLEQSRSAADLARAAESLSRALSAPGGGERAGRAELRQAFADWLAVLLRRLEGDAEPAPAHVGLNLEEVKMTLEERVAEWPKPYIRQGREEGISLGREEGIGLGRAEGISLGREEGISQGRAEGISLGREEGLAHERQLLRRLAAARFGAATADRLARALAAEADPERLAAVGEAIVRCSTGDELLRETGIST